MWKESGKRKTFSIERTVDGKKRIRSLQGAGKSSEEALLPIKKGGQAGIRPL